MFVIDAAFCVRWLYCFQTITFLVPQKKLVKEDACAEVVLMDEELLRQSMRFYSTASQWLLKLATGKDAEK